MTNIKSFEKFHNLIVERSTEEMMDYITDISTKPETSGGEIKLDTSKNPLWDKISMELSKVGKPKKLMWKDYGTEIGRASLNWGTHAGRGDLKGMGKVCISIDSSSQMLMITFEDPKSFDSIMKNLGPYNFKRIDHKGANGKLLFASYEGFTDAQPVILAVKNVLGSFGL